MIYTAKRFVFTSVLVIIAFGLFGSALAVLPETEIFDDEIFEDYPAAHDSDPGDMYDIDEVGMPEIPIGQIIFMQWEKDGYPDDIGGFYYNSDVDSYGVLVVNPNPKRMSELLEMFRNDVIITPCRYSYNELMRVQKEITEMMMSNPNSGIYGNGIGWISAGGVVHGFGDSGKEFRVTISVDESVFDHYNTGLTGRYGDRVYVEIGSVAIAEDMDGAMIMEGGGYSITSATIIPVEITGIFIGSVGNGNVAGSGNIWPWIITGIVLFCALVLFVRFRLLPIPAIQTANGGIVTEKAALTGKQIIAAIKNSGSEPGEELFHKIMKRIDNT